MVKLVCEMRFFLDGEYLTFLSIESHSPGLGPVFQSLDVILQDFVVNGRMYGAID